MTEAPSSQTAESGELWLTDSPASTFYLKARAKGSAHVETLLGFLVRLQHFLDEHVDVAEARATDAPTINAERAPDEDSRTLQLYFATREADPRAPVLGQLQALVIRQLRANLAALSPQVWSDFCPYPRIRLRGIYRLTTNEAAILRDVHDAQLRRRGTLRFEVVEQAQRGLFDETRDELDLVVDNLVQKLDLAPHYSGTGYPKVRTEAHPAVSFRAVETLHAFAELAARTARRWQDSMASERTPREATIVCRNEEEATAVLIACQAEQIEVVRTPQLGNLHLTRAFHEFIRMLEGPFERPHLTELERLCLGRQASRVAYKPLAQLAGPLPRRPEDALRTYAEAIINQASSSATTETSDPVEPVGHAPHDAPPNSDQSIAHGVPSKLKALADLAATFRAVTARNVLTLLAQAGRTWLQLSNPPSSAAVERLTIAFTAWEGLAEKYPLMSTRPMRASRTLEALLRASDVPVLERGTIQVVQGYVRFGTTHALVSLRQEELLKPDELALASAQVWLDLGRAALVAKELVLAVPARSLPPFALVADAPEDATVQPPVYTEDPDVEAAVRVRVERERERELALYTHASSRTIGLLTTAANRALVAQQTGRSKPLAVTNLEHFAHCAFRGFVRVVLGARPELAQADVLSRADEGVLMHEALASALVAAKPEIARSSPSPEAIVHAGISAVREFLAHEPSVRGAQRLRILDWTERVLRQAAEDHAWVFAGAEIGFGERRGLPALTLGEGEGAVKLRGRIDRFDVSRHAPKRLRVIDYKRGSAPETRVLGVTSFQLGIYAMVLAKAHDAPCSEGMYLTPSRARGRVRPIPAEVWTTLIEDQSLASTVTGLVTEIRTGNIQPRPSDARDCDHCDAFDVCRRGPALALEFEEGE
jgi:hypothetical protein